MTHLIKYISILIQLSLSLTVAQQKYKFIHYDLYPWNIIIEKYDNMFSALAYGWKTTVDYSWMMLDSLAGLFAVLQLWGGGTPLNSWPPRQQTED